MNTFTGSYLTRFSSGTIAALLILSSFLFLVPFAAQVNATQPLPTMTVTSGAPMKGATPTQTFSFSVKNPSTNPYAITSVSVTAPTVPSGWHVTSCTGDTTWLNKCVSSSTGAVFTFDSSGAPLPPGQTMTLSLTVDVPAPSSGGTYPYTSSFTTSVQDASSAAYYPGPSLSVQVMDPTTSVSVSVTPGGSNTATTYTAGTEPYTVTATVSCTLSSFCPSGTEAGLPIVWSAPAYAPGTSFSFTPSTGTTDSSGKVTSTFQPSNHKGDSSGVRATVGTSSVSFTTAAITTQAGPPAAVSVTFSSFASNGNHYVTTSGTTANGATTQFTGAEQTAPFFSFSLTDQFGNSIALNNPSLTSWAVTVTPSSGALWDAHSSAVNLATTLKCTSAPAATWTDGSGNALTPSNACPSGPGPSYDIPYDYFQSGTYGFQSTVTFVITGVYASVSFTASGISSGAVVTSAFASTVSAPTLSVPAGSTYTLPNVPAGSKVNVTASAGTQANVPVTIYLDTVTSYETAPGAKDYGASSMLPTVFPNGMENITLTTKPNGQAAALFTVDTVAGAHAFFVASFPRPDDSDPNKVIGPSSPSTDAITVAGPPSTFSVGVFYDPVLSQPATSSVPSQTLFVDVTIADAYGNTATNPGPGQIQISFTYSSGTVLSVQSAYIPSGFSDTAGGFGPITWTMPGSSAIGTTVTLTASGALSGQTKSGSASVSIVSPSPTISIESVTPGVSVGGVFYVGQGLVTISGKASVSSGYPPGTNIVTVTYKVDSGSVQSVSITPSGKVTFTVATTLSNGLHTLVFNATDSKGNKVSSTPIKILVDTTTPTIKFNVASGSTINFGQSVTATVVSLYGDLNTTLGTTATSAGIVVTRNGTLVTSGVTVSPTTATPGTNTTYTVTISNLPAGTWVLQLSTSTLAGKTATASVTVTVSVPFAQSVVVNSATYTTLGGFKGVSVSATNLWTTSQNLVVFAVWKNSAGQTVAVTTGGLTLAPGQSATAFAPLTTSLPSGTYTVNVFVVTTDNKPVSVTTTVTVTL